MSDQTNSKFNLSLLKVQDDASALDLERKDRIQYLQDLSRLVKLFKDAAGMKKSQAVAALDASLGDNHGFNSLTAVQDKYAELVQRHLDLASLLLDQDAETLNEQSKAISDLETVAATDASTIEEMEQARDAAATAHEEEINLLNGRIETLLGDLESSQDETRRYASALLDANGMLATVQETLERWQEVIRLTDKDAILLGLGQAMAREIVNPLAGYVSYIASEDLEVLATRAHLKILSFRTSMIAPVEVEEPPAEPEPETEEAIGPEVIDLTDLPYGLTKDPDASASEATAEPVVEESTDAANSEVVEEDDDDDLPDWLRNIEPPKESVEEAEDAIADNGSDDAGTPGAAASEEPTNAVEEVKADDDDVPATAEYGPIPRPGPGSGFGGTTRTNE